MLHFGIIDLLEMSQKRQQREEGTTSDDKGSKKSHSFRKVVFDVMNLQRLQNLMYPAMEPLVRRIVKEEVDSALEKFRISMKRNCERDTCPSELRRLQLQFVKAISLPVFTGTRIEGEGCSPLEVALVDVLPGKVVSSGLGSFAHVEIVVLEGDFDGDGDNWLVEEFTSNIVRERGGKKPLLTGDLILSLKDGIGSVGDLSFTDNSSWTRSRKFRLGARIMDDIEGIRVREAKSEPFVVRDHRGELYKKHHPPQLLDEVWRLEKIGKDGALHRRLSKEGINTVQEFLILLSLNPTRLRNILGSGMSSKKWEVTMEHAQTCVLEKTLYMYSTSTSLQQDGVVFNAIGQVMGMFLNGQYVTNETLSEVEKANARDLVISAYVNRDQIITLDESALSTPVSPCLPHDQSSSNPFTTSNTPHDSSSLKISTDNYPQLDTSTDVMHPLYSSGDSTSFEYCLNNIRCDQPLSFADQAANSPFFDVAFCATDQMKYLEDNYLLHANMELSTHLYNNPLDASCIPCSGNKARKDWGVLAWVLRWRFSIKRIVAKKSNQVRAMP